MVKMHRIIKQVIQTRSWPFDFDEIFQIYPVVEGLQEAKGLRSPIPGTLYQFSKISTVSLCCVTPRTPDGNASVSDFSQMICFTVLWGRRGY